MDFIKQVYAHIGAKYLFKMRGLALLCLVGLILATLATKNDAVPAPMVKKERALRDVWHPLNNTFGFPPEPNVTEFSKIQMENETDANMTTNLSIVPVVSSGHNETIHNGALKPDETTSGMPLPADDQKSSTTTTQEVPVRVRKDANGKNLTGIWHPMTSVGDFPPESTDGNVIKMENETDANMTRNSSIVPVVSSGHNETIHNGTLKPDETTSGMPLPADDKKSSTTALKKTARGKPDPQEGEEIDLTAIWHPLGNVKDFPPEPTDGNLIMKQK
ncbi:uncharacterized protein [Channa argus]|uniref:uncharacterized protein isoform X2 n=1 Tax=Channa argus TaxID=215402 RepID=UPI0029441BDE|nr:hypothetical protein Q8A73_020573 [Channa argus]